MKSYFF